MSLNHLGEEQELVIVMKNEFENLHKNIKKFPFFRPATNRKQRKGIGHEDPAVRSPQEFRKSKEILSDFYSTSGFYRIDINLTVYYSKEIGFNVSEENESKIFGRHINKPCDTLEYSPYGKPNLAVFYVLFQGYD